MAVCVSLSARGSNGGQAWQRMSTYRQIEYIIRPNGTIEERVLNGEGHGCTDLTAGLEQELGVLEHQELLPEFYEAQTDAVTEPAQEQHQGIA